MRNLLRKVKGYLIAFLAGALAVLSVLFFGRRSPHYEAEQDDHERRLAEKADQKAEDRADQTEDAQKIREQIRTGTLPCVLLIFAVILALVGGAHARAAAVPAAAPGQTVQSGPYVPTDYDTLKRYYLAAWDLSEKWRQLYLDAEASVTELRESNARLLAMVESQRREIEALRNRGPSFGLVGGGSYSPAGPGLFIGATITF